MTEPASPYTNHEAIRERVQRKHKAWTGPTRAGFLQAAKGNILFRQGHHWIRPVGNAYGDWRPSVVKKGTPMPVTNVYAAVMKTFTSMLARFEPALTFRPATDEPEDRATADVATRAIDAVQEEVQITLIRQLLAEWVGMTGGAWLETGWDASMTHGVVNLPMEVCTLCGSTQPMAREPICQQPECGGETVEAPDISAPQARGRLFVEVRSLFEMIFDPFVGDPTKHRALIRQSTLDEDDAKARWKDHAERITADSLPTNGSLSQDSLATLTPALGDLQIGSARVMWQGATTPGNSRVTETWFWELPTEDYPEGLLAIFVGRNFELCVHAGPLPYASLGDGGQREPFLPFVFFPQELVPGSAWPRTVANDVRPKNAQRNLWESLVIMAGQRVANPVWLIPQGCNITNPTGEPGQMMHYNAMTGQKPERIPGMNITPSWIENIARIDKEIQELTAIFEVLSGGRPEGISAGIALQILKERGESRFGPMFQLWHHAWAQWAKQALEIFRQFATEERVLQIKGRDGLWEVQKFLGADLTGRINVVPEAGMSMPRSTMTERATIEQLAAMGVINPAGNPEDRLAVLEEYGMLGKFSPNMEKAAKRAIMENEAFEALAADPALAMIGPEVVLEFKNAVAMAANPLIAQQGAVKFLGGLGLVIPEVHAALDDHAVHAREIRNLARSERFLSLPPLVQALIELHAAVHDFVTGQQQQALIAARQGTSASAGFLAPPGPRPGGPPSTTPMQGPSSPNRLEGEYREMEERAA
ncbi:MAG TPA: hypothetical protein VD948_12610 [Rhodothermales bacterium]|nr:hypothetical protein [Rhodothermales bacterium]